jgi:4-amino-4-deoxy-L-arabinose transferase-like glycosyltransferase
MKPSTATYWRLALLVALGLITAFYLRGAAKVPFHPDESTYLYMSSDLGMLFRDPASLAWTPDKQGDLRQHYRAIDAPLTRYLLGIGLGLAGLPPLPADWDWTKSWEENQISGALPVEDLLRAGRITVILLLPFCLVLIYLLGAAIAGRYTGLLAAVFLGLNALTMLHNRRAMAEGALTFGILLAAWSFLKADKRPWLAGLAAALAFNAKHSALALLPVGLLAVCWVPGQAPARCRRMVGAATQYMLAFGLLTLALNPYLWRNPLQAARATWSARQELLESQLELTIDLAPEQALDTPAMRAIALVANTYITPPSFAEAGNYLEHTEASQAAYLTIPGHNLLRGLAVGGLLLILTVSGLLIAGLRLRRAPPERRRAIILMLLAPFSLFLALSFTVPLPWQRYSIPLLPFASLWAAYTLGSWMDQSRESARAGSSS